MTEPANATGQTDQPTDTAETGLISDEQLPEDLQPAKNPLAADPDDERQGDEGEDATGPKVEGMPDMGDPTPGG